jgi:hypothetical protein
METVLLPNLSVKMSTGLLVVLEVQGPLVRFGVQGLQVVLEVQGLQVVLVAIDETSTH